MNSSQTEPGEPVIFQPVLQAYPSQALLDRHCTRITWKFGMTLEALQETTHQNSAIPQILGTTSISINTTAYYTSFGII